MDRCAEPRQSPVRTLSVPDRIKQLRLGTTAPCFRRLRRFSPLSRVHQLQVMHSKLRLCAARRRTILMLRFL